MAENKELGSIMIQVRSIEREFGHISESRGSLIRAIASLKKEISQLSSDIDKLQGSKK